MSRAFRKFIDWQIAEGSDALVPVGTTGESPTLTHDEHKQVVEICIDQVAGRVPVIAGTGSNSTAEAIDFHPARRRGRCRRRTGGHPLLQQAEPGGAVPALQGGARRQRHPDP